MNQIDRDYVEADCLHWLERPRAEAGSASPKPLKETDAAAAADPMEAT